MKWLKTFHCLDCIEEKLVFKKHFNRILEILIVTGIFLISLWIITILPLGPSFSFIPGDYEDSRFNNFVLENFFKFISGQQKKFWSAPFFYPYPNTIALSDNHIGTGLFYSFFRFLGFNREGAFQAWYICGIIFNFFAAYYVLRKMDLKIVPALCGAVLFSWGLPIMAQEGHLQLLYRFCIPLCIYQIYQFKLNPKLTHLAYALLFFVWQLLIGVYIGYFLLLFIVVQIILLPFVENQKTPLKWFLFWKNKFEQAWKNNKKKDKIFFLLFLVFLLVLLLALFIPYFWISKNYGVSKSWVEIEELLPRVKSYFISDNSILWGVISNKLGKLDMHHEQQLFPGISSVFILLMGVFNYKQIRKNEYLLFNLFTIGFLILLTLNINGFSIYQLIVQLPVVNNVRAVSRIILVLMWPIAFSIGIILNEIQNKNDSWRKFLPVFCLLFLITDSAFFHHSTYSKAESIARLEEIKTNTVNIDKNNILFLAAENEETAIIREIDSMLIAQELGVPTLNGYSASSPKGYSAPTTCTQLPKRIISFMSWAGITDNEYYKKNLEQAYLIGFEDCETESWKDSVFCSGDFSSQVFSNTEIIIQSLSLDEEKIKVSLKISNQSNERISWLSLTNNYFRMAWRYIEVGDIVQNVAWNVRFDISDDILPGEQVELIYWIDPPDSEGAYLLQITALQENVGWFHERGFLIPSSDQKIVVEQNGDLKIY